MIWAGYWFASGCHGQRLAIKLTTDMALKYMVLAISGLAIIADLFMMADHFIDDETQEFF